MCSTFHEFIWLSTKCYTHSEEDVGSAGDQGRSHKEMSIDKGKGHDPTGHPGHPLESISSNDHASPSCHNLFPELSHIVIPTSSPLGLLHRPLIGLPNLD